MRIGLLRRLVLLTFVATALPAASHAAASVPDWVRDAAKAPLPKLPDTTKAVILLDDTTYTVDARGRATEHRRVVTRILRPQGRRYGTPAVWFDKDSKLQSLHVWSIDPAGHEYALKDNEIIEAGAPGEGGILFSDVRYKYAEPPGRDPGGVVAYEYTRAERPYLAETIWDFQGRIPRIAQTFRLELPAGFTYTTAWSHHAKVEAADLENHAYVWTMNDQPGIDLERVPMSPSTSALTGRMTVHYSGPGLAVPQDGTWQGIGEWYEALAKDRLSPTAEVSAKAVELTQGKTDFYDKAEAIGEFVQKQIRYFDIEVGVGGFMPHLSGDIFHDRYGDCKDHASLLSAMLSAVGIHSALVLVDSERGVIDPGAPSLMGDHMIGAIEIPDGYTSPKLHSVITASTGKRYLIFDPTWTFTPFGQLEDNLQGSTAVLLEGGKSQIIHLPVLSPDLNHVTRTARLQLAADGTLEGTITEKRFGDLAETGRYLIAHDDARELQQFIDRKVGQDLTAASVTNFKSENVDALNKDLTMSFHVKADHYATSAGPLLMVRPRVMGRLEMPVDNEKR
ncbi:MAG: DUF3857 and transglutaminase domain-containing protein, partial [Bryocella sp.]